MVVQVIAVLVQKMAVDDIVHVVFVHHQLMSRVCVKGLDLGHGVPGLAARKHSAMGLRRVVFVPVPMPMLVVVALAVVMAMAVAMAVRIAVAMRVAVVCAMTVVAQLPRRHADMRTGRR